MAAESEGNGKLRLALGSDLEGQALKERLIADLREDRHSVKDCGGHKAEPAEAPEVVSLVAQALASGEADLGIVVASAGAVASLAANKIPGVRACHCQDTVSAAQCRRAAAADVLCLGARVLGDELAVAVAQAFVATEPSDSERHQRLRGNLDDLEADFETQRVKLERARDDSD